MIKKKNNQENSGQVIIPNNHPNPPLPHEMDAALILSRHYQTTVEFIVPIDDYLRKSADILMLGAEWELKTPKGASKSTIYKQFRRASKQAKNIIIDSRYTKLRYERIETSVLLEIKKRQSIKKVILIDKSKNIVEFFR
jgi:hypothetical protein